jgi:hypothetical protein
VFVAVVILGAVTTALAYSGGPGHCTPGGGQITVNDANADSFDKKWDEMDTILDGGSHASITLNESEISSRAERYFGEKDLDFEEVRVCIHDGYGEATGKLDYGLFGLQVELMLTGTMDLTGDTPKVVLDSIEFGSVPDVFIDIYDAILPTTNSVDDALDDIELKHTYTPTLTEGQAQIEGVP